MEVFVVTGPDQGRSFPLSAQSVIGRDPTAAVHLTDAAVSRRHAIITLGEGKPTIEDLGSFNGTQLNGSDVNGESPIEAGDHIRLGQSVLELRELPAAEDPEALKPTKLSLRPPD